MDAHLIAAAVLVAGGYALRWWALRELGRVGHTSKTLLLCWIPEVQAVDGPYRWMRHPAYVGAFSMTAGLGILCLGWGGAVVAYAMLPHWLYRAAEEDRMLSALRANVHRRPRVVRRG